jgi:RNA polymerase sigma-70 factor (ECF subfamily)
MDAPAFQNLLRKHRDRVFSHAYYFLRNREDAEDVAQEVFVKLWENRNAVELQKVEAWLMRVVHNRCIDCHRRRSRIQDREETGGNGQWESRSDGGGAESDPERELDLSETQETLLAAMQNLPPAVRSMLLMHYFEDLGFEKIAGIMGLTENAVKVAVHRGRKKLKALLEKHHPEMVEERNHERAM